MGVEKKFLVEYPFEGNWWAVDVYAYDRDEAERRVQAMCLAKVCGEIVMELPAGMGWITRLTCWWRNLWA